MTPRVEELDRLLGALEMLSAQEELCLLHGADSELLTLLRRSEPVVTRVALLAREAGDTLSPDLHARGLALFNHRQKRLEHITTQLDAMRLELTSIDQAQARLRSLRPAYQRPEQDTSFLGVG